MILKMNKGTHVQKLSIDIVLGPLINTLDDFWRMVWNEKCDKIVMLTNLIEDDKVNYFNHLLKFLFLKCISQLTVSV